MAIVIPILLVAFLIGFAVAGSWCKNTGSQIFVGILLGLGFLVVLGAVAFAGCAAMLHGMH